MLDDHRDQDHPYQMLPYMNEVLLGAVKGGGGGAYIGEVAMTLETEEKNSSSSPRLCIFSNRAIMDVPIWWGDEHETTWGDEHETTWYNGAQCMCAYLCL